VRGRPEQAADRLYHTGAVVFSQLPEFEQIGSVGLSGIECVNFIGILTNATRADLLFWLTSCIAWALVRSVWSYLLV